MSTSKHPNGATAVSPYLTVTDVNAAADFYQRAFKFHIAELAAGEDGDICHGEMKYDTQLIMMGKQGAYGGDTLAPITSKVKSPITLYLYCDDVDAFYRDAVQAGAKSLSEPQDMFWGDRCCQLECPNGYIWSFATNFGTCQNSS